MSASATALRVVQWACEPLGQPPPGDPLHAAGLARPNPELDQALRDRRYLGYDFPRGLDLHRAVVRLRGASP